MSDTAFLFFSILCFVVAPYYWIIGKSVAASKSVIPYWVFIGLHVLITLLYIGSDVSGSDAAGRGMQYGLMMLSYIAANIGLTFVAWVVFLVRKRLDAAARNQQR